MLDLRKIMGKNICYPNFKIYFETMREGIG